jgi:hypothetical protein
MDRYSKHVEVRWSDLDPNFHLRHSVYYDWGAYARLSFMQDKGITAASLVQLNYLWGEGDHICTTVCIKGGWFPLVHAPRDL